MLGRCDQRVARVSGHLTELPGGFYEMGVTKRVVPARHRSMNLKEASKPIRHGLKRLSDVMNDCPTWPEPEARDVRVADDVAPLANFAAELLLAGRSRDDS